MFNRSIADKRTVMDAIEDAMNYARIAEKVQMKLCILIK